MIPSTLNFIEIIYIYRGVDTNLEERFDIEIRPGARLCLNYSKRQKGSQQLYHKQANLKPQVWMECKLFTNIKIVAQRGEESPK